MKDAHPNESLAPNAVKENAFAIAEIVFDTVAQNAVGIEILKDVPFISFLAKVFGLGSSIRDQLFLKKLRTFLEEAGKGSADKREAFRVRLANEPGLAGKCGESVLLLLDKLSELSKAQLMGFAFRCFMERAIDDVVLNRIYAALEFVPLWQLIELPEHYFERGLGSLSQDSAASLQPLGLVGVFYGDKDKRLHADFPSGNSYFLAYHQPFYRATDIGTAVAGVIRDYLAQFKDP